MHSDIITERDIHVAAVHDNNLRGVYVDYKAHGSRKRARAFELTLTADDGKDVRGNTRRRTNSGKIGAGVYTAATWYEWGDFFANLFRVDPKAIIGPYDGLEDFEHQTAQYNPKRDGVSPWAALTEAT
jgi:hypothetical protein